MKLNDCNYFLLLSFISFNSQTFFTFYNNTVCFSYTVTEVNALANVTEASALANVTRICILNKSQLQNDRHYVANRIRTN